MIVDILFWTVFGALSGWIVMLLHNTQPVHMKACNIALGALGGLFGGFCTRFLFAEDPPELWILGVLGSLLGATLVLALFTLLHTKNNVI